MRKKSVCWLGLAALVMGYCAGQWRERTVHAQSSGVRTFYVPKAWGSFRAVYNDQLLFEDEQGTIRSVYPNGAAVVFAVTRK